MMLGLPQLPPHLTHLDKRRQYRCDSRQYNKTGQVLDVWRRGQLEGAPVMVWLPGGAWASASRFTMQGHSLMSQLVDQGWICLSVDYRTAPRSHWPAQLDDALAAVEWARKNVQQYGGNPDLVTLAGASAGGHIATLVGQLGAVEAVASLYGSYDWESWDGVWRHLFMGYIERVVVGKRQCRHPQIFRNASPLANVDSPFAAPQIVIHGTQDWLISVHEARKFAELSGAEYVEVPNGVHGFDLIDAGQCHTSHQAIAGFLERVRNKPIAA